MFLSRNKKSRLAAVLILCIILAVAGGCTRQEDEPYSSPSFNDGHSSEEQAEDATPMDATLSDALMVASFSDAYPINASMTDAFPASLTDAYPVGMYDGNVYYNGMAEFKITVDGERWRFYDAVEVASATGATEDDVNNLWYGYKSAYDLDTCYACIVSNKETGSTIIVSYVNPANYMMPDYTAKQYLSMMVDRYEDVTVRTVTFLGQTYECLDIPAEQTSFGRRTQFAIDKDGLIIIITFTMNGDARLDEAVGMLTPLYY